jgi:transcriptional regulator with PAS, ATPase and Fis domain
LAFPYHAGQQKNDLSVTLPPDGLDLEELIRQLIVQALEVSGANKTKAAKLLGISRPTLIYRIEKHGIVM